MFKSREKNAGWRIDYFLVSKELENNLKDADIHHDVMGRFGAGRVVLRTAVSGTGIIAGGAMRAVFEALGIQDIVSKCTGSTNPHNMVRATFDALSATMSPRYIANKRGKKISEVTSRRTSVK